MEYGRTRMVFGWTGPLQALTRIQPGVADSAVGRGYAGYLIHDLGCAVIMAGISHPAHNVAEYLYVIPCQPRWFNSLADPLETALRVGEGAFLFSIADARKNHVSVGSCLCHEKFLHHQEIQAL